MKKMKKFGALSLGCLMAASITLAGCGGGGDGEPSGTVEKDYYEITVACQTEDSEQEVLKVLKEEYEKKNTNTKITIKTFTGKDFETYMNTLAQDIKSSPNIVWTSDTYHGRWDEYFTDLRPFYERSAETDYSLYYSSMLDTAATNGYFKPTKNYTGSFNREKDANSDGLEDYTKHSEYGLYFAPRDYNKPVILCNTALFSALDEQYAKYFASEVSAAGYQSTTARLNAITQGTDWDDIDDMFVFAKMVAERIGKIVAHAETLGVAGAEVKSEWGGKTALDLKLDWEPVYTTILNAMGVETIINADGTLNLAGNKAVLEDLHNDMYAENYLYYAEEDDTNFGTGATFMKVVSRPVVLSYRKNFITYYGEAALQSIQIPTEEIAAGCSGYAICNYYHDASVTVNGVTKSYDDICWDFIKFIISAEGQEIAGASGSNIPVMKSLEENGAWRSVAGLEDMNDDAWIAGEELAQDWYNIYQAKYRTQFRTNVQSFFKSFKKSNYVQGSLDALISATNEHYATAKPTQSLR